jgi:hypothetical protein
MPAERSLSRRFDYLFEPIEVGESTDAATGVAIGRSDSIRSSQKTTAPVRMAFAAFVLGTLGVAAAIAALLAQSPDEPTDDIEMPLDPAPLSTAGDIPGGLAPIPPVAETVVPTEASPPTTDTAPPHMSAPVPTQMPPPRQSHSGTAVSPSTRAPISVAPQSRPPFPHQGPRGGNGNGGGGGLLGRLL